jgi:hypothetical protein
MHDVAWSRVRFRERWVVQLQGVNVPVFGSWDGRRAVEIAVGCCLLLNAAALRDVGLFDDAYFAYHEDVDWCLRARKAGWELFYEPYSRVYHVGSASTHALRPRPPAATILPDPPGLANAEPLPWNPVRAYLGARNVVRLMRAHASLRDRAAFVAAFLRAMPLEITAIVLDREGWLKLGRWTWSEMASAYFLDRRGIPRDRPAGAGARIARAAHLAWSVPVDVLWWFPRYAWRAHREGRTAEFVETLRGLRDGALGRALPLDRLGLR